MARLTILVLLGFVIMTMAPLGGAIPDNQSPEAVAKWFEKLQHAKPKLTKLHFYLHNNFTGNKATVVQVAQANTTSTSPTRFGLVLVIDALLTMGSDVNSKEIGRAQGIVEFTGSQKEWDFSEALNFVFTSGKYNGSSLQLLGWSPSNKQYKELPLVGGTGDFRLAQGSGIFNTLVRDATKEIIDVYFFLSKY